MGLHWNGINHLATFYRHYYWEHSMEKRQMPPFWWDMIIALISKDGKNETDCSKFHPINVLKQDDEISVSITSIQAKCPEMICPDITQLDPTGFIKQCQTQVKKLRIINYQNKYHKPSGIIWINGGWANLLYQKGDVDRAARSLHSYLPSLSSLTVSGWDRTGRKMASDCLREKIKLPYLQMTPWDNRPGPFTLSRFKQRADQRLIKHTSMRGSQWVKSQSLKTAFV